MLNEERIILMTQMASYEANEGKKNVAIGMYIFYDFEVFMMEIYKMDLLEFAKDVLFTYLKTVGVYALISYLVYSFRYRRARKSLRLYYANLHKLAGMYKSGRL